MNPYGAGFGVIHHEAKESQRLHLLYGNAPPSLEQSKAQIVCECLRRLLNEARQNVESIKRLIADFLAVYNHDGSRRT